MKKLSPAKFFVYFSALVTFSIVSFIIIYILAMGLPQVWNEITKLFSGLPSIFEFAYNSENASIVPSVINTIIMIIIAVSISASLGIATAIYLVEYAKTGNKIVEVIRITSETLSGIPSIIYGLFGYLFFVVFVGFSFSLIAGILTISIMILPLIIRSTEEALKAVPISYREASFGLGAAKLRTIFKIVLPSAANGILAGIILAIGRIVGETAALIYTSGSNGVLAANPIMGGGRTMSVHMYMLSSEGRYMDQAFATAAILLLIIVGINYLSTFLAKKLMNGAK